MHINSVIPNLNNIDTEINNKIQFFENCMRNIDDIENIDE
jgi:hypothetical protein